MLISSILDQLLDVSAAAQAQQSHLASTMTKQVWINQHCTIRLRGPRGAGHSYAALWLFHRLAPAKLVVLTPNSRAAHNLESCIGSLGHVRTPLHPGHHIFSIHENWSSEIRSHLTAVVLDDASEMTEKQINEALGIAAGHHLPGEKFFFILLG